MKFKFKRAAELNSRAREEIKEFTGDVESIRTVLAFPSSIIILLKEKSEICGVATLIPAFSGTNESLKGQKEFSRLPRLAEKNNIWELRLYGNGNLFRLLEGLCIPSSSLGPDRKNEFFSLEDFCNLKRKFIEEFPEVKVIIGAGKATDEQKDNLMFLKSLSRIKANELSSELERDLNGYNALRFG